jgi:hypothetical protein
VPKIDCHRCGRPGLTRSLTSLCARIVDRCLLKMLGAMLDGCIMWCGGRCVLFGGRFD